MSEISGSNAPATDEKQQSPLAPAPIAATQNQSTTVEAPAAESDFTPNVLSAEEAAEVRQALAQERGLTEEEYAGMAQAAADAAQAESPYLEYRGYDPNTAVIEQYVQSLQSVHTFLDDAQSDDATTAALARNKQAFFKWLAVEKGNRQQYAHDLELTLSVASRGLGRALTNEERDQYAALYIDKVVNEALAPFGGQIPEQLLNDPTLQKLLTPQDLLLASQLIAARKHKNDGIFTSFANGFNYAMAQATLTNETWLGTATDAEPISYAEYMQRSTDIELEYGKPQGFSGVTGSLIAGLLSPFASKEAVEGLVAVGGASYATRSSKPLMTYIAAANAFDAYKATSVDAAVQAIAQNPALEEQFQELITAAKPEALMVAGVSFVTDLSSLSTVGRAGSLLYGKFVRASDAPAFTKGLRELIERTNLADGKFKESLFKALDVVDNTDKSRLKAFGREASLSFILQNIGVGTQGALTQAAANRLSGVDGKSAVEAGFDTAADFVLENVLLSLFAGGMGALSATPDTPANISQTSKAGDVQNLKDHADRTTQEAAITSSDVGQGSPKATALLLSTLGAQNSQLYRFSARDIVDQYTDMGLDAETFRAQYELNKGDFDGLEEMARIGGDIEMTRAHWDSYYAPTLKDGREDVYNFFNPYLRMGDTSRSIKETARRLGIENTEAASKLLDDSIKAGQERAGLVEHIRTSLANKLQQTSLETSAFVDYISSIETYVFQNLASKLGVDAKALYDKYAPEYATIEHRLNLSGQRGKFDDVPETGGAFDSAENRIYLGQDASVVSVLHEWSHSFLSMLDRIASDVEISAEARATVKADLVNLKQAIGYKSADAIDERMQERFAAAFIASLVGDRRDLHRRTKTDAGLEVPEYAPDLAQYNADFARLKRLMVNALTKAYEGRVNNLRAKHALKMEEYKRQLAAYEARRAKAKRDGKSFNQAPPKKPEEPDYNAELALEEYRSRFGDEDFSFNSNMRDTLASYVLGDFAFERQVELTGNRMVFDPKVLESLPEEIADDARQAVALGVQQNDKLRGAYQKLEAIALEVANKTAEQRLKLLDELREAYLRDRNQQADFADRVDGLLDEMRSTFKKDDLAEHGSLYVNQPEHVNALNAAAEKARTQARDKALNAEVEKRYKAAEKERAANIRAYKQEATRAASYLNDEQRFLAAVRQANALLDKKRQSSQTPAQHAKVEQWRETKLKALKERLERLSEKYSTKFGMDLEDGTHQRFANISFDEETGQFTVFQHHDVRAQLDAEIRKGTDVIDVRDDGNGVKQFDVVPERLEALSAERFPETDRAKIGKGFTEEELKAFDAVGEAAAERARNNGRTQLEVNGKIYTYAVATRMEREARTVDFVESVRGDAEAQARAQMAAERAEFQRTHPRVLPEEFEAFESYVRTINRLEREAESNTALRNKERAQLERNPAWALVGYFNDMPERYRLNFDEVRESLGENVAARLLDLGVASKEGTVSLSTFGSKQAAQALGALDGELTRKFEAMHKKLLNSRAVRQKGGSEVTEAAQRTKGRFMASEMSRIASRDLEKELTLRVMRRLMKNDKALANEYVRYNPYLDMLLNKEFVVVGKQELKLFSQIVKFLTGKKSDLRESDIKGFSDELLARESLISFKPERLLNVAGRARDKAHDLATTMLDDPRRVTQVGNNLMISLINHQAARDGVARVRAIDFKITRLKSLVQRSKDKLARHYDYEKILVLDVMLSRLGIISKARGAAARKQLVEYGTRGTRDLLEQLENDARFTGDYKQKSLPELESALQSLWDLRRYAAAISKGRATDRHQQMLDTAKEAITSLQAHNKPKRSKDEVMRTFGVTEGDKAAGEGVGRGTGPQAFELLRRGVGQTIRSGLRRVEQICHELDGGIENGPVWRLLYKPIRDAIDRAALKKQEVARRLGKMVDDLGTELNHVQRIEAPELKRADGSHVVFGDRDGFKDVGGWELMGWLVHIGNESNYTKLLEGYGFTREQFQAFFDRACKEGIITKKMMDTAQAIWDANKSPFKKVQQAYYRTKGIFVKDVEARKIETPWGTYEGGYAPAVADRNIARMPVDMEANIDTLINGDFMSQYLGTPGFLKERSETYREPLDPDISISLRATLNAIHYGEVFEPVSHAYELLNNRSAGLGTALEIYAPGFVDDVYRPFLSRALRDSATNNPKQGRGWAVVNSVTQGIGMSYMFANVVNVLQGFLNLVTLSARVPPWYIVKATIEAGRHYPLLRRSVMLQSKFMLHRFSVGTEPTVKEKIRLAHRRTRAEKSVVSKAELGREHAAQFMNRYGYFAQTMAQHFIDVVTWTSAKEYAIAKKGMSEADACSYADIAVRETQGSLDPIDRTNIEAGGPVLKMFTQFTSYFNTLLNLSMVEIKRTMGGDQSRVQKALSMAHLFAVVYAIPAIMSDWIMEWSKGNEVFADDEEAGEIIWTHGVLPITKQFTAMIPVGGSAINSMVGTITGTQQYGYGGFMGAPAAISAIQNAFNMSVDLAKGDGVNNPWKDGLTALGIATRIPVGTLVGRRLDYLDKVEIEEANQVVRLILSGQMSDEEKANY